MAKKSEAEQTPEEIAEERIAEWKRDPSKPTLCAYNDETTPCL